MIDYNLTIGLIPMRRDVTPRPGIFNWEKAEQRGIKLVDQIRGKYADDRVGFVDLEGINDVGVLYKEEDVELVAKRFAEQQVDAILIINGNFGNEEVAGQIAKAMGKPVLLWAPLDDEYGPDGMRYTDSQCGIFGISKQLQRRNIPFTYIETSRFEDEVFDQGFRSFLSVSCMVKNFQNLRIGQVGTRPKPFCSVMINESELLSNFDIQLIPINLAVIIDKYKKILEQEDEALSKGAEIFRSRYEVDGQSEPLLKKQYAFVILFEQLFKEYRLKAISAECWTAMQLAVGAMPCSAYSILADMGYIIGCESDFHGTLTMLLLSCASLGRKVPFFGEFTVRHPSDNSKQLLWHCGPFAYSLKKPDLKAQMVNMRQYFQVKDGQYTVARMDQNHGKYYLLGGTCDSTDGPHTFGTYLWAKFKNRSAWERKLVEGPYIHHMAEIEGDYTRELKEFCKYIPGLQSDEVDE